MSYLKRLLIVINFLLLGLAVISQNSKLKSLNSEYYRITVYHFENVEQEKLLDTLLQNALIPSLHNLNFNTIGVFKPIANDTAIEKKIYLIIRSTEIKKLINAEDLVYKSKNFQHAAKSYLATSFDKPYFTHYETILLKAFKMAPKMVLPILKSPKAAHIYELRSYESSTDAIYKNKVQMFNEGEEIALFKKLNFNAVFYATVLSGSRMPNLMYITSFENMEDRNEHWKAFGDSPEWKAMSSLPIYQHNVKKADIILMKAATYSEF